MVDKICTRPFACDLDGDGRLDIVSGNFRGTFALFKGEGDGSFAPKATWLSAGAAAMTVPSHSDPFLIDWDGDGDLDLLSGSALGGAFLFRNEGTRLAPKFGASTALLTAPRPRGRRGARLRRRPLHRPGPQHARLGGRRGRERQARSPPRGLDHPPPRAERCGRRDRAYEEQGVAATPADAHELLSAGRRRRRFPEVAGGVPAAQSRAGGLPHRGDDRLRLAPAPEVALRLPARRALREKGLHPLLAIGEGRSRSR
ncbi:MAG: VCBS repeat-containing protein [Planctomycetes bacterium]|nr:VCBS repeat-containing protein [Planctomycetota bacterium]